MKKILSIAMFFALIFTAKANYLRLSNISYDLALKEVNFDITWNNTWRIDSTGAPSNWDAAWVFIKWRPCDAFPTDPWTHGIISTNLANNSFSNLEPVLNDGTVGISPAPENLGVMLRQSTNQVSPTFANQAITLNITNLPAMGDLDLRVMGIEMVYVPQGKFLLDNATLINSQTTVRPNGYNAFHCMKYEISQQQYAEFLNALPSTYASDRFYTHAVPFNRYYLSNTGTPPLQYFSERPDRACNYLSWQDVQAYLDWAALRPMDQDEYIKACRGTGAVIVNEFAWGTSNIVAATQFAVLNEDGTETISTPNANCNYNNTLLLGGDGARGPVRVGIFATSAVTTREQAGAGYYGMMDMTGNVTETGVHHTYDPNNFDGAWGNGYLNANSDADVATWPLNTRGFLKGGGYSTNEIQCRMNYLGNTNFATRLAYTGGRGVR